MTSRSSPQRPAGEPDIPAAKRAKALRAVVEGLSDVRAGKVAEVDRETIGALRRAPAFAAEVRAEVEAMHERWRDTVVAAKAVGIERLMREAKRKGPDGVRAAIELVKLGEPTRVEHSGKAGGPIAIIIDEAERIALEEDK